MIHCALWSKKTCSCNRADINQTIWGNQQKLKTEGPRPSRRILWTRSQINQRGKAKANDYRQDHHTFSNCRSFFNSGVIVGAGISNLSKTVLLSKYPQDTTSLPNIHRTKLATLDATSSHNPVQYIIHAPLS